METANESGSEEVASHVELLVAFEKEPRWFQVQKERDSIESITRLGRR